MKWFRVDEKIPEPAYEFGGSQFSEDVLALAEDGTFCIANYFFPWRNMKLEGFRHDGSGKIVAWAYIYAPEFYNEVCK